ncbi:hypothetical protein DPMN_014820 [Dreissena polymorpha]|uniref:VWFC domain-containing protein n=1 Tax=Dreissena polymorpha TaxID=45954 RepID=A0A9D4S5L8_DREPO|nr:hypothetical protein DPMN_014820 [Dreissena polymorpha]
MIHQLPDCSAVSCIATVCNGFYTPPGECCPICPISRCEVKGVNYEEGVIVPSKTANPCESCICRNGSVQCTIMICLVCKGITPPGQCCPICRGRPD